MDRLDLEVQRLAETTEILDSWARWMRNDDDELRRHWYAPVIAMFKRFQSNYMAGEDDRGRNAEKAAAKALVCCEAVVNDLMDSDPVLYWAVQRHHGLGTCVRYPRVDAVTAYTIAVAKVQAGLVKRGAIE